MKIIILVVFVYKLHWIYEYFSRRSMRPITYDILQLSINSALWMCDVLTFIHCLVICTEFV